MTITVASTTATGSYTITVTGAGGTISHTAAVTVTVTPGPGFAIAASAGSISLGKGAKGATDTITTTVSGGFSSAIALSVVGTACGHDRRLQFHVNRRARFRVVDPDADTRSIHGCRHVPTDCHGNWRRTDTHGDGVFDRTLTIAPCWCILVIPLIQCRNVLSNRTIVAAPRCTVFGNA